MLPEILLCCQVQIVILGSTSREQLMSRLWRCAKFLGSELVGPQWAFGTPVLTWLPLVGWGRDTRL